MTEVTPTAPSGPPAGWYDDPDGSPRQRWYDGTAWTEHFQTAAVAQQQPIQVTVQNSAQPAVRQARDKAQYTRPQTGHSLTKHILLVFVFVGMFTIPYYSISPNHYWRA